MVCEIKNIKKFKELKVGSKNSNDKLKLRDYSRKKKFIFSIFILGGRFFVTLNTYQVIITS
jgi:hypothetical protein